MNKEIESPCVNICSLYNGYCIGCLRSEKEIVEWSLYSKFKRLQIFEQIEHRTEKVFDNDT